jgi:hypothetical protein
VLSLRAADPVLPNRIQREFLFNDAIQSQNTFPASSHPRQKTNLLKLGVLSLRAADRAEGCAAAFTLYLRDRLLILHLLFAELLFAVTFDSSSGFLTFNNCKPGIEW